jgi:molybdopterin-binding protein
MKISARNVLKGKVKKITEGMVNSEVVIELAGGQQVVAVVTKTSEQGLGLAVCKEAYAIIKATSVMLGVD